MVSLLTGGLNLTDFEDASCRSCSDDNADSFHLVLFLRRRKRKVHSSLTFALMNPDCSSSTTKATKNKYAH